MDKQLLRKTLSVSAKTVLPTLLGVLGTLAAVAWTEGYSAFCGL